MLLLSLLGLVTTSCAQSQEESSAATATIKGFYHYYIVETDKTFPHITFNEDTLQTYCTASFLKKWYAAREYDRVLQAQDDYSEWAQNLTVAPLNNSGNNAYKVCFLGPLNHCIIVTVKQEQGKWKIDDTQVIGDN
jgi:aminoglycoside/choline kinase family phosphotransferase